MAPHGTTSYIDGHGRLHREDGPAYVMDGFAHWYLNGLLHCTQGPAVYHGEGRNYRRWYVHGRQLTEREFDLYVDRLTGDVLIPPGKKLHYDP